MLRGQILSWKTWRTCHRATMTAIYSSPAKQQGTSMIHLPNTTKCRRWNMDATSQKRTITGQRNRGKSEDRRSSTIRTAFKHKISLARNTSRKKRLIGMSFSSNRLHQLGLITLIRSRVVHSALPRHSLFEAIGALVITKFRSSLHTQADMLKNHSRCEMDQSIATQRMVCQQVAISNS